MAISPFTKPVKQGEFIPKKPRLPVESIGSAVQNVYKQNVQQRDRLNQMFNKIAKQDLSSKDRQALREVEERLRGEMEELTKDDGLLFDNKTRISEMARNATQNIQRAKKATENRQQTQKNIQEAQMPQWKRDLLKKVYSSSKLKTREDGNVDPKSIPGVKQIGDEPEGGLADVARDALSNLRQETMAVGEDGQIEQTNVNQNLGVLEFLTKSGVSKERMKSAIMNEFSANPNMQNWLDHQITIYKSKGHSPKEARKMARNDLDSTANNIARARSFENIDISRRNRPDHLTEDSGTRSQTPIQFSGGFAPTEDYYGENAPQTEERKSYIKTNIQTKLSELSVPQEDIRKIIDVVENGGKKLPEGRGPAGGPPQIKGETKFGPKRAVKRMEELGMLSEGTYDKFSNVQDNVTSGGEISPTFIMPAEDSEDFKELQQAFSTLSASQITSPEIQELVRSEDSPLWWNALPGTTTVEDAENQIKRDALSNVENVAVDSELELMRVKVNGNASTPEDVRGRTFTFKIPDDSNLDTTFANMMEKNYPDQAEVMKSNNKARREGLSVTYDNWTPIERGRAKLKRKRNGNIQLRYKDSEGNTKEPTVNTLVENAESPQDTQALAPMIKNMSQDIPNNPIINTELAKYAIGFARGGQPQEEQAAQVKTRLQHYANQMDNIDSAAQLKTMLENAGRTLLSKNPSFENIGVARDHAINLANQSIGE